MPEPYFHYSQYNSIRFAQVVEWDNYDLPKTVQNTLSYQEDGLNSKNFYQLYQLEDAVRLQFKSSYPTNEVIVKGCSGGNTAITPIKRTDNFDVSDVRGASVSNLDGDKFVVYFEDSIPEWMVVGSRISVFTLAYGYYTNALIIEVLWLEDQGVYGLNLDLNFTYTGGDLATASVISTYDKFEYDIYEFDIDFSNFSEGKYQVTINASGITDEPDACYQSEILYLKEVHENTYQLISEHDENTQINYSWGIQHMMRLEAEIPIKFSPDGDKTIHKTDSNTLLLDSSNYENYELELSPLPTGMAINLSLFISLSTLFIGSRSYVASVAPDTTRIGDNNLYDCKLSLILANDKYNNKMENYRNGAVTPGDFNNDFNNDFL